MDWPETLELTLDGIAQGGEGVGRWGGRVVFAGGGLPGEHVRVRLRQRHDAYAHGAVTDILIASAERVPPRLPGADWMPWQHIAYPAQLRFKRQILADQLAKIGGLTDIAVAETLPAAHEWEYRNSAQLHCDGTRIGYYAAGSRTLQAVAADPLLLPALNQALAALHQASGASAPPRCEITLRASECDGYTLAALRPTENRVPGLPGTLRGLAARWRAASASLAGVALLITPPVHVGASHLVEELGGVTFQLSPTTFFQVNRASAEALLGLARAGLGLQRSQRLLDLYCGAGAFALPLAGEVAEVVGVEEHAAAVADARATAVANAISNAHFEVGPVERVLERIEGPFDAAILDPPRRGCHPQALEGLLRLAPTRLIYVSCHPATLARDLKILVAGGYQVRSVQPVDLFPQTPHIESVCILEHGV
jgi:23S rRNA (uracil1939-C5)-methyltransferase